jgi:hypothetical protein
MKWVKLILPAALAIFCSAIFGDSLRYKFTNHRNTQEIFGRLNEWAGTFGMDGLFAQTGLFSQYTIGTAEAVASLFLLMGILPRFKRLQGFGALLGLAVMTGAISFHLFTPLGVDPNNDGGGLFLAACLVWVSCFTLVIWRRKELGQGIAALLKALFGQSSKAF